MNRTVTSHQRAVLRHRARSMRHEPTQTEWRLWRLLRAGQLGAVFRRQVVLQGYIADFYASSVRLIVEVDGSWHASRARADVRRDRVLRDAGYRVLHVSAAEVLSAPSTVASRIQAALQSRP